MSSLRGYHFEKMGAWLKGGVLSRGMMATEEQIETVLRTLDLIPRCPSCDTRLRFGDRECPRCGHDIEDQLREWATALIQRLGV